MGRGRVSEVARNDGRFGRWAPIEVTDPWDAKKMMRQ